MSTDTCITKETAIHTSFNQLFSKAGIAAVEIPLIQRDYAQGRQSQQVTQIRERFIADLCDALVDDGKTIDLDFVFGHVLESTLYPLDGQQRLTTLFLLHCYLAWHLPDSEAVTMAWHKFSYATRPSARYFCKFLLKCRPDVAGTTVSEWLTDQAAYLPTWKHDPTIGGMLVTLDAIQTRFASLFPANELHTGMSKAWERLIHEESPAIRFHLLPIHATDRGETLYVKMNSRGKPLTEFENIKAEIEQTLTKNKALAPEKVADFLRKADTDWADLFWAYRGDDTVVEGVSMPLIDEEFMRYLRFVMEVLAWKCDLTVDQEKTDAEALYELSAMLLGSVNPKADSHLDWLIEALDVWLETNTDGVRKPVNINQIFEQIFTREKSSETVPLRVFNFREFANVDLFRACCDYYGVRPWRLAHTLLFYGVLRGRIEKIPDVDLHRRLRLLRNLIDASQDEIRAGTTRNNMPKLISEVERIVTTGLLDAIDTFNQVQLANERAKRDFLQTHPSLRTELERLEDHDLLRGGLTVFDLSPNQPAHQFVHRAQQFVTLFQQPYQTVTGALLAKGDYSDHRGSIRWTGHRLVDFGAPKNSEPWQTLFRGKKEDKGIHPCTAPLMDLLDDLSNGTSLNDVISSYLASSACAMDWRYYLVKYEVMREGDSGRYAFSPSGYQACMLDKWQFNSNYRDPYLLALVRRCGLNQAHFGDLYFYGYENVPRNLVLKHSGLKIRCLDEGWGLMNTSELSAAQQSDFGQLAAQFGLLHTQGIPAEWLLPVAQNAGIDCQDRIELGADLLKALVEIGL